MNAPLSLDDPIRSVPSQLAALFANGDNGSLHEIAAPLANGDNGPNSERVPVPLTSGEPGQPSDRLLEPPQTEGDDRVQTPDASPLANGDNGRDTHGRFTRGNRGGPGNPFARQTAALRRTFADVVTEADMETLARQLLERALKGDLAAAKVMLAYAIGKPTAAVDPDTLDIEEWKLFQYGLSDVRQIVPLINSLPIQVGCVIMRNVAPQQAEDFGRMCRESLEAEAAESKPGSKKPRSPSGARSRRTR